MKKVTTAIINNEFLFTTVYILMSSLLATMYMFIGYQIGTQLNNYVGYSTSAPIINATIFGIFALLSSITLFVAYVMPQKTENVA